MNLVRFILKRIGLAALTLFALATMTFFLMRAVPGDPLARTKEVPEATRRNLEARYGLDKPIHIQYVIQMRNIFLRGDFGASLRTTNREVNDIIEEQFPVSAALGLVAVGIGVTFGLFLGIFAALYRNTLIDRTAMFLCVMGIALPSFIIAYILQYTIAVYPIVNLNFQEAHWLRPAGWGEWKDYLLPAIALSMGVIASITRVMRSQMVDVGFSEYVKTAKAKGVSTFRLVVSHQIRNAILPIISILGPILAVTVTGSLIIEGIFGVPGLGRTFQSSIQNADYNVIMGLTVFYGGFVVTIYLITDIIYGLIDPRIRVG